MKIIHYVFILIVSLQFIYALPIIFSSTPHTTIEELVITDAPSSSILSTAEDDQPVIEENSSTECPTTEYGIVVEHFAQLVATHWQFDHLDTIISNTYRTIAEQFQKHIQITTQSDNQDKADEHSIYAPDDRMDFDILHAQIFGAIQAHTEGSLPLAWDHLADKLDRPALESYIRNITLERCTLSGDLVSSTCLQQKAEQLSMEIEEYIRVNLEEIYTALDDEVLPELLTKTGNDLVNILNYFNQIFLIQDSNRLSLTVIPWKQQQNFLNSRLIPLLSIYTDNDNHPMDFFSHYTCLSRA